MQMHTHVHIYIVIESDEHVCACWATTHAYMYMNDSMYECMYVHANRMHSCKLTGSATFVLQAMAKMSDPKEAS